MNGGIDLGIEGLDQFSEIGSGGFSTVYAAQDSDFKRWVAVKVLHSLDGDGVRRFERERELMGQLDAHANVVTPYRSGYTTTGWPYLVMEYLRGGSLHDLVAREGPLPWARAAALVLPIADALGHGHEQGILHRDVKPANILLTASEVPKLTDFGISAIREATATQIAYTLAHAAPETFKDGYDRRDERSDLYSLASTLYTMVVGHPPFSTDGHDSQPAQMMRILEHPVPALDPGNANDRATGFLAAALAKDPSARPANAADFIAHLRTTFAPIHQAPAAAPAPATVAVAAPAPAAAAVPVPVDAAAPAPAPAPASAPEPGPSSSGGGRRLWAGVAALALVAVGIVGYFMLGPDGESTAGSSTTTASVAADTSPSTNASQEVTDLINGVADDVADEAIDAAADDAADAVTDQVTDALNGGLQDPLEELTLINDELNLDPITFSVGSGTLTDEGQVVLDEVVAYLEPTSALVQISAHTDTDGSTVDNIELSQQRAEAVRDYLVASGIAENRLVAVGFGESMPVADNSTPEGKALNRRIDLEIVG